MENRAHASGANSLLENSRRLRAAFAAAKRAHPEPYEDRSDPEVPRTWRLVGAHDLTKNQHHRGLLVLQESRGERALMFTHWNYTARAEEVAMN